MNEVKVSRFGHSLDPAPEFCTNNLFDTIDEELKWYRKIEECCRRKLLADLVIGKLKRTDPVTMSLEMVPDKGPAMYYDEWHGRPTVAFSYQPRRRKYAWKGPVPWDPEEI